VAGGVAADTSSFGRGRALARRGQDQRNLDPAKPTRVAPTDLRLRCAKIGARRRRHGRAAAEQGQSRAARPVNQRDTYM